MFGKDAQLIVPFVLYNLLFFPVLLVSLPFYMVKQFRRGGLSWAYLERFGLLSRRQKERLAALDAPVWIHAVSIGEVHAALTLIERWRQAVPGRCFVLSTTTTTGHAIAEKRLPASVPLLYCPMDDWGAVWRIFRRVRPSKLVLLEVEIWPNLIWGAARRGVPVILANGRLSEHSAARYARHRWFFGSVFKHVKLFCMQTDTDAARIRSACGQAGAPVVVSGTMKFDQVPDREDVDRAALLDAAFGTGERLVLTAGSTHPGEEAVMVDAFLQARSKRSGLKMILVPRHHERSAEVEALLRAREVSFARLSRLKRGEAIGGQGTDVLLVDMTGELMGLYAVSDIVFVGKSMAGHRGGHNIIEPAIFAKSILHGSGMDNFRTVSHQFRRRNATLEVADPEELQRHLDALIADSAKRGQLGARAREVVEECRGATERTVSECEAL